MPRSVILHRRCNWVQHEVQQPQREKETLQHNCEQKEVVSFLPVWVGKRGRCRKGIREQWISQCSNCTRWKLRHIQKEYIAFLPLIAFSCGCSKGQNYFLESGNLLCIISRCVTVALLSYCCHSPCRCMGHMYSTFFLPPIVSYGPVHFPISLFLHFKV